MNQKRKIPLYVRRTFSEKFSAAFDYLGQNWKPLLKWNLYLFLPLCLFQALTLNKVLGAMLMNMMVLRTDFMAGSFFRDYALALCCYVVGIILFMALFYSLFALYNERENGLEGIRWKDIAPSYRRNALRSFRLFVLLFLVWFVICIALGLVAYVLSETGAIALVIVFFLGCLALVIPMTMLMPIYFLEKIRFFPALGKAFRLGFGTWWSTFAIIFVLGLLSNVLQSVTSFPFSVVWIIRTVFMQDGAAFSVSPYFTLFAYLGGIVMNFGTYLVMNLMLAGTTYQYGHATEVLDTVTIDGDIANFEQMK